MRRARYFTGLFLSLLLLSPALAQEIHSTHCLHGCPSGSSDTNDLIIREIYILSSNDMTKFADWTAYKVTAETIGPTMPRNFKADPLLDASETLEPEDYNEAHDTLHTDRGHQVPLASFTGTTHWTDTNFLSNITPQKSQLNNGAWGVLEARIRNLAQGEDIETVYVMTGPTYERNMPNLPKADEPHLVPSGYWKIVAVKDGHSVKVAAFFFDQDTPSGANICDHLTTVDEIERKSGLDFFYDLDETKENQIESGPPTLESDFGCAS